MPNDDALVEAYAGRFYLLIEEAGVQMEQAHPELTQSDIGKILELAFEQALLHSEYEPTV